MKGFIFSVNEIFLSGRREDWMAVLVEHRGEHIHIFGNFFSYLFIHTDVTRDWTIK